MEEYELDIIEQNGKKYLLTGYGKFPLGKGSWKLDQASAAKDYAWFVINHDDDPPTKLWVEEVLQGFAKQGPKEPVSLFVIEILIKSDY